MKLSILNLLIYHSLSREFKYFKFFSVAADYRGPSDYWENSDSFGPLWHKWPVGTSINFLKEGDLLVRAWVFSNEDKTLGPTNVYAKFTCAVGPWSILDESVSLGSKCFHHHLLFFLCWSFYCKDLCFGYEFLKHPLFFPLSVNLTTIQSLLSEVTGQDAIVLAVKVCLPCRFTLHICFLI